MCFQIKSFRPFSIFYMSPGYRYNYPLLQYFYPFSSNSQNKITIYKESYVIITNVLPQILLTFYLTKPGKSFDISLLGKQWLKIQFPGEIVSELGIDCLQSISGSLSWAINYLLCQYKKYVEYNFFFRSIVYRDKE